MRSVLIQKNSHTFHFWSKQDIQCLWQYGLVSALPCHVLNKEYHDISIMSKMSAVGAGVRAGSILGEGWWGRGDGQDWGTSTDGLLHSLAAMSLWSMSGWLSSPVFILWGEWGCFKWDFGGLEGGSIFSFRLSHDIGLCRLGCMTSTMISRLLTGTQTKIKTAIAVTSLHS